jgi:hypothetical protein
VSDQRTVVVAGITRSGLSVTMQMLHAGGFPCVGSPPAFEEFPVGKIPWGDCAGKAVKLVDAHLQLPQPGRYHVITPRRLLRTQAKSWNRFAGVLFGIQPADEARIVESFTRDYATIAAWARRQESRCYLSFGTLVTQPRAAAEHLAASLGVDLDIDAMAAVVRPRGPGLHPTLLELEMAEEGGGA